MHLKEPMLLNIQSYAHVRQYSTAFKFLFKNKNMKAGQFINKLFQDYSANLLLVV